MKISPGSSNALTLSDPGRFPFDPAYERFDDTVQFSFSLLDPQPRELTLRLYEVARQLPEALRESLIGQHISLHLQDPGFEKSGRFVQIGADSLDTLAKRHGMDSGAQILAHPSNADLRMLRCDALDPADFVFIPQLRALDRPLPLGPCLDVMRVDEAVEGGQRYGAIWDIKERCYDPLDWMAWRVERAALLSERDRSSLDESDHVASTYFFMPQFAVKTTTQQGRELIYVAPTPMQLVDSVRFEGDDGEPSHAFLADGPAADRITDFSTEDEPIIFLWT